MSIVRILEPEFSFEDQRGVINQLVSQGYRQVNFVTTKKGAVRGNFHYHKRNDEAFFVAFGKIRLTVLKDGESEMHTFSQGDMFLVEKFVKHKFEFLEDTGLVGLYSDKVENEDGTKDIYE